MHTRADRKELPDGQPARGAAARMTSLNLHTRADRFSFGGI